MGGGGDARGTVHVHADIAAAGDEARPRVDADADRERATREAVVHVRGGRECRGCLGEDGEERIALRVDLDARVCLEGVADDAAVVGQHTGVALGAERVQEGGRPLDVREEERHRPRGERRHGHGASMTTTVGGPQESQEVPMLTWRTSAALALGTSVLATAVTAPALVSGPSPFAGCASAPSFEGAEVEPSLAADAKRANRLIAVYQQD